MILLHVGARPGYVIPFLLIFHLLVLREGIEKDASNLGREATELKEQIEALREKDRQNLEELKM